MPPSKLDQVIGYAERGWHVLPLWWPLADGSCACSNPECESIGKHPYGRFTPHGVTNATTDKDAIRKWWSEEPNLNVGIATGAISGIVVYDIDNRHGGDESFHDWEQEHGEFTETPRSLTGAGFHILFRHPGFTIGNGTGGQTVGLPPGIDRRGDGGYIVAPPSVHAGARRRYKWETPPDEVPLADIPEWLTIGAGNGHKSVVVDEAPEVPEEIDKGARNAWLTSFAGTMRRRGGTVDEIYAALTVANQQRAKPPLPEWEVRRIATSIAARPASDPLSAEVAELVSRHGWSTPELLHAHFTPLRWVVDGLLPEDSLVILGGKKKVGKSWLARQIAGAVGSGDAIFGRPVLHGPVLYYCLEDGERRMHSRMAMQDASDEELVTYLFTLPPLNEGGAEQLTAELAEHKPILTVIDTLAAAKSAKVDENAAGPMADLINALQRLARSEHTCVLLVAHHGKSTFGDSGHDIRGSSAIAAAADVNLGLYKKAPAYVLTAEGRDLEEAEFRMEFEDFRWKLRGDERALEQAEKADAVLDVLAQLGESDAGSIAREIGWSRQSALRVLKELEFKRRIASRTAAVYGEHGTKKVLYRIASINDTRDDVYRGGN